MKRIEVRTSGGLYPVLIGRGLLDHGREALRDVGRTFLVTDENVAQAGWAERVARGFEPAGTFVLPPGEKHKSLAQAEKLLDALIEARVERGDHVLALGGGMVGDMAGFAAAVLKRGCSYVQIPTTLLAQVDSSVGGKTGVNTRHGKNLIGAFHQPAAVLIDPATLETLPERELRAGYAEAVKYGLIGDPDFFAWCEGHAAALIGGDEEARLHAIETCVRAKAEIVTADERETAGTRMLLNFGHSFGHALEAETGLSERLLHGEAVALGMALAFRFSALRGLCPPGDSERVEAHLGSSGLPVRLADIGIGDGKELAAHMRHDKKSRGGRLPLVLTRGIGRVFVDESVGHEELTAFLESEAQPG